MCEGTPEVVSVASRNTLYLSHDAARTFDKVAVFKDEQVRQVFFDTYQSDALYDLIAEARKAIIEVENGLNASE